MYSSLKILDVADCQLTDSSIKELIRVMKVNKYLLKVRVKNNKINHKIHK